MFKLGEFELLVLLAILRQDEDNAFANRVREDLERHADRRVTRSALYRTLDRLRVKGLVDWRLESLRVPERGGHPSRRLWVTARGLAAVRRSRTVLFRFFDGLEAVLDPK